MKMISDLKHHTRNFLAFSTQTYRVMTTSIRLLPDFLIIGAQRCGTTSLYYYLTEQPCIAPASVKEIHFFDDDFLKGLHWYRAQFPTTLNTLSSQEKQLPLICCTLIHQKELLKSCLM